MNPLYDKKQFDSSKSRDLLPLECHHCGNTFYRLKKEIKYSISRNIDIKYCSGTCRAYQSNGSKKQIVKCTNCNTEFLKMPSDITKNNFCSRSCSTTYNNKNKTTGTRRSKLEIWLENQLPVLHPEIEFHFNKKDAIGSELDIYLPALSLAFELNGIFHYEPIYGDKKLGQIQENDQNKFQNCITRGISLCIIDVSQFKHFKPDRAQKYLDIINDIIKERLLTS